MLRRFWEALEGFIGLHSETGKNHENMGFHVIRFNGQNFEIWHESKLNEWTGSLSKWWGSGIERPSYHLWGMENFEGRLPNAIHWVPRSRGVNNEATHIEQVKVGIRGHPIWVTAIRSEGVISYGDHECDLIRELMEGPNVILIMG